MDGSFVSSGKNYTPAGVSRELGGALFYYDVFAHQLALGGVPQTLRSHPLVVRQGESALPSAQFKLLVDRANTSERALWFRRLAQRYEYPVIHPIGEFSLRATDSGGEYPVKIEVSSWLTFYPRLWYSPISVPAAWGNTAAMIPYGPLQKDMEERWSDYRKAFRQMDELTSIFEAYTVLKLAKRDNAKLWNAFRVRYVTGVLPKVEFEGAELQDTGWRGDRDTLLARVGLCRSAIGTKIETTHQANLALSLMWTYKWSKIEPEAEAGWKKEIAELAKRNPNLEAKLVLAGCLRADPAGDEVAESIERFLKIVRQSPDLFRLRVQGIHRLARLGPKLSGRAEAMLRAERRAVLADFHNQVAGAVSRHDTDLFVWENLIQDVYSTDLIEDAKATSEGGPSWNSCATWRPSITTAAWRPRSAAR